MQLSSSVVVLLLQCIWHPLVLYVVFFLMIRRPPRSTLDRSSAASDVYKRQTSWTSSPTRRATACRSATAATTCPPASLPASTACAAITCCTRWAGTPSACRPRTTPVSYTHLRAHETVLDLVCRLLLEKNNKSTHMAARALPSIQTTTTT